MKALWRLRSNLGALVAHHHRACKTAKLKIKSVQSLNNPNCSHVASDCGISWYLIERARYNISISLKVSVQVSVSKFTRCQNLGSQRVRLDRSAGFHRENAHAAYLQSQQTRECRCTLSYTLQTHMTCMHPLIAS